MLFIDARNYYTAVDRTLNEWTDWQLKNLNAIVWLYRGEVEKYTRLLEEYRQALSEYMQEDAALVPYLAKSDFSVALEAMQGYLKEQRKRGKAEADAAPRREKKSIQKGWEDTFQRLEEIITVLTEAVWLVSKFGEGVYADIPGLCKVASREEIKEKGYSLTPGAYVGVAAAEDDGVDFEQRMKEIHQELLSLQRESNELMETISRNLEEMGL